VKKSKPYRWPGLRNSSPVQARCQGCGALIGVGCYEGWPLYLDPPALDLIGETEAWIRGQPTYLVCDPHIYRRSRLAIEAEYEPKLGSVQRTHSCGAPAPVSIKPEPPAVSDECPF
jgi:hypothetical protein